MKGSSLFWKIVKQLKNTNKFLKVGKKYCFSNAFWLYQHWVKYVQYQCFSHLFLTFSKQTTQKIFAPTWNRYLGFSKLKLTEFGGPIFMNFPFFVLRAYGLPKLKSGLLIFWCRNMFLRWSTAIACSHAAFLLVLQGDLMIKCCESHAKYLPSNALLLMRTWLGPKSRFWVWRKVKSEIKCHLLLLNENVFLFEEVF